MRSIVPYFAMQQAVTMVKDRIVNMIVVAYDSKAARQLAIAVAEFGGHVVFVHPVPTTIHPPHVSTLPDMEGLIFRWFDAGRTEHEIAQDLQSETTDVRAVLRRGGRYTSRSG